MFSSKTSTELSAAIEKATRNTLTSDDWEAIIQICDLVNDDPQLGPKIALKEIQSKILLPKANTQLRALSVLDALEKNCSKIVSREILSPGFLNTISQLLEEDKTHTVVKSKILELINNWSLESEQKSSFIDLKKKFQKYYDKYPKDMSSTHRKKPEISEEEEVQLAIALSLSQNAELENKNKATSTPKPKEKEKERADALPGTKFVALHDFTASESDEVSFRKGDIISFIKPVYENWWKGSVMGEEGIFPKNYVAPVTEPSQREMKTEARMELDILNKKSDVLNLLEQLSQANEQMIEDVELQALYQKIIALRPSIVRLIGKYSKEKVELAELYQEYSAAEQIYNHLLKAGLKSNNPFIHNE